MVINVNRSNFSQREKDLLSEHSEILQSTLCKYLGAYNSKDKICHCTECKVESLCHLYIVLHMKAQEE